MSSSTTRIRFPGCWSWFRQRGAWWDAWLCLHLFKCMLSGYHFTFYPCAIILVGCYTTSKVTGDPLLYLGCSSVGVGEVGLLQAAVCPAHGTCSEVGWEHHAGGHEEGTCQLDHRALARIGCSFVHCVQKILHDLICQVREREKPQLSCWGQGSRDCSRAQQLSALVLTPVLSENYSTVTTEAPLTLWGITVKHGDALGIEKHSSCCCRKHSSTDMSNGWFNIRLRPLHENSSYSL